MTKSKYEKGDSTRYRICPECGKRSLYLADFYIDLVECLNCDFESQSYLPHEISWSKEQAELEAEKKWFQRQEDGC